MISGPACGIMAFSYPSQWTLGLLNRDLDEIGQNEETIALSEVEVLNTWLRSSIRPAVGAVESGAEDDRQKR